MYFIVIFGIVEEMLFQLTGSGDKGDNLFDMLRVLVNNVIIMMITITRHRCFLLIFKLHCDHETLEH